MTGGIMDKYDQFMQEIVDYLKGTWLAKANQYMTDDGPIRGSSEAEIEAVEQEIGKKIPAALKAWYRVAGAVPPYLNDYDATNSLQDFRNAQEVAFGFTRGEASQWKITDHMLPFSQRMGEQFIFVDTSQGNPDDPPVFHFSEGHNLPTQVDMAFSVSMRGKWLIWLDHKGWNDQIIKEMRHKNVDEWLARKKVLNILDTEVREFRQELAARIYQEDMTKDVLTGPRAFQERWKKEFAASDVWQKLKTEGLRFPYDFIDPPE
jgi:hypothetical protein